MKFILDFLYVIAGMLYSPVVIYRAVRHNRYRCGWGERFGKIRRNNPEKKCIWIHAVSVGEVNAAKTVVKELQNKFSDLEIVISTTTDTGQARANAIFGSEHKIIYFPFDFSWVMRRAFRNINPAICLLMELEVWPNYVNTANKLNVPVVIVNGRISDRSFSRYSKIKPLVKGVFSKIDLALAQTEEYAGRFKQIGVPENNVIVTGSLKYDTAQVSDKVEGSNTLAAQLQLEIGNKTQLWIAGATGPGEEEIILDVYKQLQQQKKYENLTLIIVPRKPERFDEVAQLIINNGFECLRYSKIKVEHRTQNAAHSTNSSLVHHPSSVVLLGDTMGDLRKFYSLATIIFVGRSLVPMGGSDMMEAAALGKCTMFGPHAFNFKQTVDDLLKNNGAILVQDKNELLEAMRKCLSDPTYAQKIAQNGQRVIKNNQGATQKTIENIKKILSVNL
ncbi:MAG: 3-deoxy-D-manno-octulosonic acid transferase [Sedimentisphaerales bacterium]|nr:3-deoxy-D-manno-octulosonic acid transferase [Sedimentisphaerales bacterium]